MSVEVDVSWFPTSAGSARRVTVASTANGAPRALDLLELLEVQPDHVLVVRGAQPVPLDAPLADGDAVRIVWTVSGG